MSPTAQEMLADLATRQPDRMWVRDAGGRIVGFVTEHQNGWRGYSANLGMGWGPFSDRASAEGFALSPRSALNAAEAAIAKAEGGDA